ncbi:glycosyltransferase [Clostridium felsineum]|uniref:glycosyltransferase n=1 Tax=Clostridium felsineum TaxID=36839 RepID=UPI00098CD29E|nr:glycosyltransferase [Clostridium felsineum]URZ16015.1 hypothetical protein CLFE_020620 [Clostridium felsineum DSM 794]
MKILYLADQFLPEASTGTTKFIYNVVSNILNRGIEASLITYSSYPDEEYSEKIDDILVKRFTYRKINVIAIKCLNKNADFEFQLQNRKLFNLKKIIMEEKADMVHICHPRRVGGIIELVKEMKIPYIITLTDCFLICPKLFLINKKNEICSGANRGKECERQCDDLKLNYNSRYIKAQEILENAKIIITPSIFLKELYIREFKDISIKITVINHGMKFENIDINNTVYDNKSKINFGFASAASYIKGIFVLISAFNRLKKNENIKLNIYGGGNEDLLAILNENSNVNMYGEYSNDNINEVYNSMDVLICPSICYESYSFVINEAFQRKIPVIASNIGAMAEFVKSGINGFTFDVGDSGQLSRLVRMISNNPRILNYLKSNINISNRNIYNEVNSYIDIYNKINNKQPIKIDNHIESKYSFKYIHDEFLGKNIDKRIPFDIKEDFYYAFDIKLNYLRKKFKNKRINYLIWGASYSGEMTEKLITNKLKNFYLVGYVDRFKTSIIGETPIYNIEQIKYIDFNYVFICTTPGRKDACAKLKELNLKVLENYLYGYGQ